ncbi:MAG: GFA family protein [Devosia sp.]
MSDEWPMPAGPLTGGCQCGAVRFRAEALHHNPHVCYCRMCQKATGNLFAALVGVRLEHLTWARGTPARFRSSEHVDRGFCPNCGTPLFYQHDESDRVGMSIGAFDEPHRISLRWQMGSEGKHPSMFDLGEVESLGTTEIADGEEATTAIRLSNNQHPDHDTVDWTPTRSTQP